NDELFRKILRGLNQAFYHKTVGAQDIEQYINRVSKMDFTPVFNQYLRSVQVPEFEYEQTPQQLRYRWTNCNPDFNLPLKVYLNTEVWLRPTTQWKNRKLDQKADTLRVDKNFYIRVKNSSGAESIP
ncbi:MAG TPA: M1 family peptidase, partial [Puia sp.]